MPDIVGKGVIAAVKVYKRMFSPLLPRSCRYHPTCSEYMIEAVEKNGSILGLTQGVFRILRCNPFFPGGVDFPKKMKRKVWKWSRERC